MLTAIACSRANCMLTQMDSFRACEIQAVSLSSFDPARGALESVQLALSQVSGAACCQPLGASRGRKMFCERKPGGSAVLTSSKEAHCPDDPHERPKGVPQICPCVFQPNVHISLLHTGSIQHQPSMQECCSTANLLI